MLFGIAMPTLKLQLDRIPNFRLNNRLMVTLDPNLLYLTLIF